MEAATATAEDLFALPEWRAHEGPLGVLDGVKCPQRRGHFLIDMDDVLLLAMLQDKVYCPELLWDDPANKEYGFLYRVRDYQYEIVRENSAYVGFACARSVGKTEDERIKSMVHPFRRTRENLLITAPERIHLDEITGQVERVIEACRLTREFLDKRKGSTGITHRPFEVKFLDGTRIVGRIPNEDGKGVKGQHQRDLIIEEAQDYPEKGWIEVEPTVMKGAGDFHFHFYGVHTGNRMGKFYEFAKSGEFKIVQITALMRPDWSPSEKAKAKAMHGGTNSSDYRRNILGEAGEAASEMFVTARLFACMDQDPESSYNRLEYRHQEITAEQMEEEDLVVEDEHGVKRWDFGPILDLPTGYKRIFIGQDVGLTTAPSVISIYSEEKIHGVMRLKLLRRIHLWRIPVDGQMDCWEYIGETYGAAVLRAYGIDSTGLGKPMFQAMQNRKAPAWLKARTRGWFFNSKVPIAVDRESVKLEQGVLKAYGSAVVEKYDELTDRNYYVVEQPMITASTNYLRAWVDRTFLQLPADKEIMRDMQGETKNRVQRVAGLKNKPDAFHILDSFRAMAMSYHADDVDAALAEPEAEEVLDVAV